MGEEPEGNKFRKEAVQSREVPRNFKQITQVRAMAAHKKGKKCSHAEATLGKAVPLGFFALAGSSKGSEKARRKKGTQSHSCSVKDPVHFAAGTGKGKFRDSWRGSGD